MRSLAMKHNGSKIIRGIGLAPLIGALESTATRIKSAIAKSVCRAIGIRTASACIRMRLFPNVIQPAYKTIIMQLLTTRGHLSEGSTCALTFGVWCMRTASMASASKMILDSTLDASKKMSPSHVWQLWWLLLKILYNQRDIEWNHQQRGVTVWIAPAIVNALDGAK